MPAAPATAIDPARPRRGKRAIGACALVVLLGSGIYWWWPTEERAVRRRLGALAAALSVPADVAPFARVARVAQLRHFFADDVRVSLGPSGPEITSREALLGTLGGWTSSSGGWTVEFVDVHVSLGQDEASAEVYLTAKVSGRDPRTGEATLDAREAGLELQKRDGDWIIATVEARQTLERP